MEDSVLSLYTDIALGDRIALAKGMTLVESELAKDRAYAIDLLELCEKNKPASASYSFTVSGAPGAGKSSLIEKIGLYAIHEKHKVGVLTIDPSSTISKGSILGDKSRMPQLSTSSNAFIRSSPAGSVLGGIARRTRELITLLKAAGYDMIFVETVGVGQSEHIAWQLTDGFILVIQPGAGDELQGIKRGITELADIIIVNKADGRLKADATITKTFYENAIHYLRSLRTQWIAKVITTSALEDTGIDEFWNILRLYLTAGTESNQFQEQRDQQNKFWLSWSAGQTAQELLLRHPVVNQKLLEGFSVIDQHQQSVFRIEFEIEQAMNQLISSTNIQNH